MYLSGVREGLLGWGVADSWVGVLDDEGYEGCGPSFAFYLWFYLWQHKSLPRAVVGLQNRELEDSRHSRTLFASASYVCICICIFHHPPLPAESICICVRPITIKSIYLLSFYRKRRAMENNVESQGKHFVQLPKMVRKKKNTNK